MLKKMKQCAFVSILYYDEYCTKNIYIYTWSVNKY